MTKQLFRFVCLIAFGVSAPAFRPAYETRAAQSEFASAPLQALLKSHHAWLVPPPSIRLTGKSKHGDVAEPVRITVTRNEESLVEYGAKKQVFTPSRRFDDDGFRQRFHPAPGGFAELDITGVYLLAQLSGRGISVSAPQIEMRQDSAVQRLRVRTNRSETHYRLLTVRDEFDLYVNSSGLLAGLSREFYPESSLFHFTLGFSFESYRETGGVLLPYVIHRHINGQKVETIEVDAYEIGIPSLPALFEPRRER